MTKETRQTKTGKIEYRYSVNFSVLDHDRFIALCEQSGMENKAAFIRARIFNEDFRVIKVDKTLLDYYSKLISLYAQYRRIGVNYNQVLPALRANFTEKRALAMLYKLENYTIELAKVSNEILVLSKEFEKQWSQK